MIEIDSNLRVPLTAALILFSCLLILLIVRFCFRIGKRASVLAIHEESKRFVPLLVCELYCRNFAWLHWKKLFCSLRYLLFTALWLTLTTTLCMRLLTPKALPLYLPLSYLICSLLFFTMALTDSLRLRRYYKRSAFYRQTAVQLEELDGTDPESRGMRGEYFAWRLFQAVPEPRYILINPLIPVRNAGFAEVDLLLISRKGIFCVEAKNRSGMFMKNHDLDRREQWVHILPGRGKQMATVRTIENPFRQNERHIYALQHFWKLDRKYFFNVVCFGDMASIQADVRQANLSKMDPKGTLLYFAQRRKLLHLMDELPDILGDAAAFRLYQELSKRCRFSRQKREDLMKKRGRLMEQRGNRGDEKRRLALEKAFNRGRSHAAMNAQAKRRAGLRAKRTGWGSVQGSAHSYGNHASLNQRAPGGSRKAGPRSR